MIHFSLSVNGTTVTQFSVTREPGPDGSYDYDSETGAHYKWAAWVQARKGNMERTADGTVTHNPTAGIEALAHAVLTDWLALQDAVTTAR